MISSLTDGFLFLSPHWEVLIEVTEAFFVIWTFILEKNLSRPKKTHFKILKIFSFSLKFYFLSIPVYKILKKKKNFSKAPKKSQNCIILFRPQFQFFFCYLLSFASPWSSWADKSKRPRRKSIHRPRWKVHCNFEYNQTGNQREDFP